MLERFVDLVLELVYLFVGDDDPLTLAVIDVLVRRLRRQTPFREGA